MFELSSDMHKDLCRGMAGLCDAMRPTKGADLLKYLRKVNFTGKNFDRECCLNHIVN